MAKTYSIFDIYKIDEFANNVDVVEYGTWNPIQGLHVMEYDIWIRRTDLKGNHLRYKIIQHSIKDRKEQSN